MSEVVFLSNTNIQIAVGSSAGNGVKVSKLYSAPLPEGAVLNGVVMDRDLVTDTIKSAWQQYKQAPQERSNTHPEQPSAACQQNRCPYSG